MATVADLHRCAAQTLEPSATGGRRLADPTRPYLPPTFQHLATNRCLRRACPTSCVSDVA
jgi:hypothetical protein